MLELDESVREAIFRAGEPRGSGQARVNALFRLVQQRIIRRAVVLTVARQDDSLKRARDARLPRNLGREGILVLGHQEQDPDVAASLGLPRPRKGEFISVRVAPARRSAPDVAEIEGRLWRKARDDDPVVMAPRLQRVASAR
jgi:hypothetical protein